MFFVEYPMRILNRIVVFAVVGSGLVRCGAPSASHREDFTSDQKVEAGTVDNREFKWIIPVTIPAPAALIGQKANELCVMMFKTTTWSTANKKEVSEISSYADYILVQTPTRSACSRDLADGIDAAIASDPAHQAMIMREVSPGSRKLRLLAPQSHPLLGKLVASLPPAGFDLCPEKMCRLHLAESGEFTVEPYK